LYEFTKVTALKDITPKEFVTFVAAHSLQYKMLYAFFHDTKDFLHKNFFTIEGKTIETKPEFEQKNIFTLSNQFNIEGETNG
jgi:hypothetical protein